MKKITRRKINEIQELQKFGYSVRKIADKVNCSPTTVQKYSLKDRNFEIPLTNLFPEENLIKKMYTPASSRPYNESYYPQDHHYYHPLEDASLDEQQRQYTDQENKRREQEKEQSEQARKSDQKNRERLRQRKMEYYSMKQKQKKHMQLKRLKARVKMLQDYNELNKEMSVMAQEVKEEDIQKVQDNQQVREMQPRLVKVELKEAQDHQEAQDDKIQTLEPAEENESIADSSWFLKILFSGILGFCKGIESYHPSNGKGSMNKFDNYLKNDSKPKRVNLVLKK